MRFVVIDFETFYSDTYSLTKMTQEAYVSSPMFEIILCGIKINHDRPYWITGTKRQIGEHLRSLKLEECAVLAHNMSFDGLILAYHFGIYPAMYCDTRLMAQALLKPYLRHVSLESCLNHLDLGVRKGQQVKTYKNRTRDSFSPQEMADYGRYCLDDCEGEFRLFRYLAPQFPKHELEIIDSTLRMYLQPKLTLDQNLLSSLLAEVRAKKAQALAALPPDIQKADLMSNVKFAEVLRRYGVEPPLKISPTTNETTYAFAKSDTGWKELEEEYADDDIVASILTARLSAKSTLEESRYERLLKIAMSYPTFRVPIMYHAAHTGRDGGYEGINPQNFPRIDKSRMRFAVRAPKGYVVLAADLAQIECRITAWLAKQENLLAAFRNNEDAYALFASTAYGRHVEPRKKTQERFVGKTCVLGLGFGMSDTKLRATLRKDGVKISIEDSVKLVNTYRVRMYPRIPQMWNYLTSVIPTMASGAGKIQFGPVTIAKNAIIMPDGTALVYDKLRYLQNEKYDGWVYNFAGEVRTLWGGKITENIVQKLARMLVMQYMLEIKHTIGILPALRQHDELDYVVPEEYAAKVAAVIGKIMRVPPTWAPDLPVEVEINYGPTLGDCK